MFTQENKSSWDPSHLGEDYFLNIAQKLGLGRTWDTTIETLYLSKTGVPYVEKKNGRLVNPNWAVIIGEKKYRCGNATGYKVEEGLWDLSNCIEISWKELRDYFIKQKVIIN